MDSPKYWDRLNTIQQQWINDYLEHRMAGLPIMVEGAVRASKQLIERRRIPIRNELAFLFWKVVCGRQGIGDCTSASAHDAQADVFEVTDFNPNDVYLVKQGFNTYTFYMRCSALKPFLFYMLMRQEQLSFTDSDADAEFNKMKKRIYASIGAMPVAPPPYIKRPNKDRKVFLSREQIVSVYFELMTPRPYEPFFSQLRLITAVMMFVFLATRREELCYLRIEDFVLDVDGYIKRDENGWGRMKLKHSKGDYSQSHDTYGTLIVPNLVTLMNKYLEKLYKMSPYRGKGYLFPRNPQNPEKPYALRTISSWIERVRDDIDSLSETQRQYFSTHDGRHTLNELITKALVSRRLEPDRVRAAEIQMRHNIYLNGGSVAEGHYTEEIPYTSYFAIIDQSLNFPWDLDELRKWEQKMGYFEPSLESEAHQIAQEPEQRDIPEEEHSPVSDKSLADMKAELKRLLKKQPKEMTMKERTLRIRELQKFISRMEVS